MGQISKRKNNFAIVMIRQRALIRSFIALTLMILVIGSCSSPEDPDLGKDADYFPLKKGNFQIYDVQETNIDQVNTINLVYQLRTEVTDSFPNQNGGYTYIITRTKRNTAALPWSALDTWSARIDDKQLVVSEENIPYVKLSLPLAEGKAWNGNLLNTLGGKEKCGTSQETCDLYTLKNVSGSYEISSTVAFAKTVTVIQNNDTDVIVAQDVRKEVYAKDVGLIYKESTILEYCTVGPCVGKQQVEKGFIYKQVIREYGSN